MARKSNLLTETLSVLDHGAMIDSVRFVYLMGKSCLEDYLKFEKYFTDEDWKHAKIMESSTKDHWRDSLIDLLNKTTTEEAVAVYTNSISKILVNVNSTSMRIGYFMNLEKK